MKNIIKILITGDTHLGGGRVKKIALRGSERELFGEFLSKIQHANLSITNLESPLVNDATPILKTGPNLKSPVATVKVLKNAGFDLLTLANNHIMDFGREGLFSTIEVCSRAGIDTVGAGDGMDQAGNPCLYKIGGVHLGILNVAENEFSTIQNGSAGAYSLNPISNWYKIKEINKVTDALIVIVHGGHEGYSLPSPRMKKLYRFFIDAGAKAVVGHHSHCYSGYEMYKDAPIFYSLGNFLFDKKGDKHHSWNEGYMLELNISIDGLDFNIIPYIQNAENIGLRPLSQEENQRFDETLDMLNKTIADDKELAKQFDDFCNASQRLYSAYIEPHSNKYLHALRNRKLIPSLLSKQKKRLLLNLVRCEAHRDVLIKILSK